MMEWFEEWFGEEYLHLYPHRNDEDAECLVDLIVRTLGLEAGASVLDVACGTGRHAVAFRKRGFAPVGLDLSWPLLRRARQASGLPVVRSDMRALPIRNRSFDLAVNLFTSFGYFEDDADHLRALREMIATIRPGGWFVMDFLNASRVKQTLVLRETATVGGSDVLVERSLDPDERFVFKAFSIAGGRRFVERVRLYDRAELVAMIAAAGARVVHQLGSYDGGPPDILSPRNILMARTA